MPTALREHGSGPPQAFHAHAKPWAWHPAAVHFTHPTGEKLVSVPVASAPPLRRSYSGELSACAALFWLTLRQYTHGRRLLVVVLLYALPVGLAILLRSLPKPAPPDILEAALIFHL